MMGITSTHDSIGHRMNPQLWHVGKQHSTYLQPTTVLLTTTVRPMEMLTLDRHRRTPRPAPLRGDDPAHSRPFLFVERRACRPTPALSLPVVSSAWRTRRGHRPPIDGCDAGNVNRGLFMRAAALWTTGRRRKTAKAFCDEYVATTIVIQRGNSMLSLYSPFDCACWW